MTTNGPLMHYVDGVSAEGLSSNNLLDGTKRSVEEYTATRALRPVVILDTNSIIIKKSNSGTDFVVVTGTELK